MMRQVQTLIFLAAFLAASATPAEPRPPAQEIMRGNLYGVGKGLAAAIAISGHPIRTQRYDRNSGEYSEMERQYFNLKGIRVVVLKSAQYKFTIPISVEADSPAALRLIDHDWPEMTKAALIANYGSPDTQTENLLHYNGLSEACDDYFEIGLKDEKVVSVTWKYCVD